MDEFGRYVEGTMLTPYERGYYYRAIGIIAQEVVARFRVSKRSGFKDAKDVARRYAQELFRSATDTAPDEAYFALHSRWDRFGRLDF